MQNNSNFIKTTKTKQQGKTQQKPQSKGKQWQRTDKRNWN